MTVHPKLHSNKLVRKDGKTEVVSIETAASKAEGHNFKSTARFRAEAAATTTENPLQVLMLLLAQVDTLRTLTCAAPEPFQPAITNPGNTVNNSSPPVAARRFRLRPKRFQRCPRADSLAAGRRPVRAGEPVPQNVLFTALIRRLIHRITWRGYNQGSESCLFNSGACVMKEITVTESRLVTRFSSCSARPVATTAAVGCGKSR